MSLFLGIDVGSTKTHTVLADETGQILGFGETGAGNQQNVGYDGMLHALQTGLERALQHSGLTLEAIQGAGLGVSGYDWASQEPDMFATIERAGIRAPYKLVNDALPGLIAGSPNGWGVVVVSGTGCNCRGLDQEHRQEGRVTGYGSLMGEAAGATELVQRAMQMVGYAWSKRIPPTALCDAFIEYTHARNLEDLLEGYTQEYYHIEASAAPLIFKVAQAGDEVARQVIAWGGRELGEMTNGVIRQMGFEDIPFDIVYSGSMFSGGKLLIEPMKETIRQVAPKARFIRLAIPPVIGAVILGLEAGGISADAGIRARLAETLQRVHKNGNTP